MAGRVEKTVFISYRRTNLPWALFIYQNLTMHGYDVFFDYQSIDSGSFEKVILDNIRARAHFVLILTPSALERCKNPGDWLRREIETAIDEKRNIVPLMMEGFDFGSQFVKEALTGKLSLISGINALSVPNDYALEAMDRLRDRFLNKAIDEVALPALQPDAEKATEIQKSAANEAEPVQEEQLTAQTWFERGYLFDNENNLEEAYRCYSKALQLDPNLFVAHNNLGIILSNLKRYGEAEAAFRKAIELDQFYDKAHSNLGNLLYRLKHYEEAETVFRRTIELNPENFNAHLAIESINKKMGKEISKENIVIIRELMPKNDWYNLACLESVCDNFDLAFEYLEKALQREKFDLHFVWGDPDLQWIRNDPRFTKIVGVKPE